MSWPTTDNPRTEFVTVRFTADEAADIDWLVGRVGAKSRSAAVRGAVDRVVAAEKRAERKERRHTDD
jgi:hypothetical protein